MSYNDKLRLFFKSKGLSQKEVGKRLGHAPAMISRFFSGESNFGPDFIVSLVKEFPEIDLKYIFTEEESFTALQEPREKYRSENAVVIEELKLIEEKLFNIRKVLEKTHRKN